MKEIKQLQVGYIVYKNIRSTYCWFINGKLCNNKKATFIQFDDTGMEINLKCWQYDDGKLYREFGPTIIYYNYPLISKTVNSSRLVFNIYENFVESLTVDDDYYEDAVFSWILENNIILSPNNDFEIPDEYKAEFKLRFR